MSRQCQLTILNTIVAVCVLWGGESYGQTNLERAKNLVTCYTGNYPVLCRRAWLSPEEIKKTERAEYSANLKTCLTGKYPSLCKKLALSEQEKTQVLQAEKSQNLKVCSTGKYPSLCKHSWLNPEQSREVEGAELKSRAALATLYAQPLVAFPPKAQGDYSSRQNSGGCGSRGGPGWRKPDGKCASWQD